LRSRLVIASVLCIVGIILYWTPLKINAGDVNIVLGGYPSVAIEKGQDPRPWFIVGYVLTGIFAFLGVVSLVLAVKIPEYEEIPEEGAYEETEETVAYEEEIYEF